MLLLHVDSIEYETHKNALRRPPDPPGSYSTGEAVVAYVTVEAGDDEKTARAAARDIVAYARDTVKAPRIVIYPYAHLSSNLEKPHRAHRILSLLEAMVREWFDGEVHRAPFGWYKSFTVKAKGHPLAELSRHYDPRSLVEYRLDGETITLEEAARRGLLPDCVAKRRPPTGEVAGKLSLLGLGEPGTWQARVALEMLSRRIAGPTYRLLVEPLEAKTGPGLVSLLARALETGHGVVVEAGGERAAHAGSLDRALDLLEELSPGLGERISRVPLCGTPPCLDAGVEGSLLVYNSPRGWCTPVGLEHAGSGVLGPMTGLLQAAVDHELWKASGADWVPRLPAWLHPVTVYIVDVPGAEEYARTVARDLAAAGARVVIDETTKSLGPRIRSAGKMWVPIVATIGPREAETGTVTVRRRWRPGEQETLTVPALLEEVRGLLHPVGGPGLLVVL